jgi:hypothetical protein
MINLKQNDYKEIVFRKYSSAVKFRKTYRKKYGYTPAIFHFKNDNRFIIVKPRKLRIVDKYI